MHGTALRKFWLPRNVLGVRIHEIFHLMTKLYIYNFIQVKPLVWCVAVTPPTLGGPNYLYCFVYTNYSCVYTRVYMCNVQLLELQECTKLHDFADKISIFSGGNTPVEPLMWEGWRFSASVWGQSPPTAFFWLWACRRDMKRIRVHARRGCDWWHSRTAVWCIRLSRAIV